MEETCKALDKKVPNSDDDYYYNDDDDFDFPCVASFVFAWATVTKLKNIWLEIKH